VTLPSHSAQYARLDLKADQIEKPVRRKARPFPWMVFLLLVASLYFFWIFPMKRTSEPVKIEYLPAGLKPKNVSSQGTN